MKPAMYAALAAFVVSTGYSHQKPFDCNSALKLHHESSAEKPNMDALFQLTYMARWLGIPDTKCSEGIDRVCAMHHSFEDPKKLKGNDFFNHGSIWHAVVKNDVSGKYLLIANDSIRWKGAEVAVYFLPKVKGANTSFDDACPAYGAKLSREQLKEILASPGPYLQPDFTKLNALKMNQIPKEMGLGNWFYLFSTTGSKATRLLEIKTEMAANEIVQKIKAGSNRLGLWTFPETK